MFSKSLCLDTTSRIWDVFCRDGEEFLFKTAIGKSSYKFSESETGLFFNLRIFCRTQCFFYNLVVEVVPILFRKQNLFHPDEPQREN